VFDKAAGRYIKTIPVKQARVYFEDFNEFSHTMLTDKKNRIREPMKKGLYVMIKFLKGAYVIPCC
jgi:hypothetical protein